MQKLKELRAIVEATVKEKLGRGEDVGQSVEDDIATQTAVFQEFSKVMMEQQIQAKGKPSRH
jgi:hypothetical protein